MRSKRRKGSAHCCQSLEKAFEKEVCFSEQDQSSNMFHQMDSLRVSLKNSKVSQSHHQGNLQEAMGGGHQQLKVAEPVKIVKNYTKSVGVVSLVRLVINSRRVFVIELTIDYQTP